MVDVAVTIIAVIGVILLFVAMALSAMAAMDAKKSSEDCKEGCHKYSTWSAIVTGVSVVLMVIAIGIYIYASEEQVRKEVNKHVAALHGYAVTKLAKTKPAAASE